MLMVAIVGWLLPEYLAVFEKRLLRYEKTLIPSNFEFIVIIFKMRQLLLYPQKWQNLFHRCTQEICFVSFLYSTIQYRLLTFITGPFINSWYDNFRLFYQHFKKNHFYSKTLCFFGENRKFLYTNKDASHKYAQKYVYLFFLNSCVFQCFFVVYFNKIRDFSPKKNTDFLANNDLCIVFLKFWWHSRTCDKISTK